MQPVVDQATFPCDIDWPVVPVQQTQADFNAQLASEATDGLTH